MGTQRQFSLQSHKLILPGGELSPEEPVWITSAVSRQALDGVCDERSVQLIDLDAALDPMFTGVNWHFAPLKNGTWQIINQRQEDFLLGGRKGHLGLFRQQRASTHWLIFKHKTSGRYILRPQEEDWMSCAGGTLTLTRMEQPSVPPHVFWEIKRPETAGLLQRARRTVGDLKRYLLT